MAIRLADPNTVIEIPGVSVGDTVGKVTVVFLLCK